MLDVTLTRSLKSENVQLRPGNGKTCLKITMRDLSEFTGAGTSDALFVCLVSAVFMLCPCGATVHRLSEVLVVFLLSRAADGVVVHPGSPGQRVSPTASVQTGGASAAGLFRPFLSHDTEHLLVPAGGPTADRPCHHPLEPVCDDL